MTRETLRRRIAAFFEGASYAFDPFSTVDVPRVRIGDARDDARRLARDGRKVAGDLAHAVERVMPRGA
jgi:hypothetical protein